MGELRKQTKFYSENLRESEVRVEGRIILKLILRE
jgi:hypothetical protein